MNADNGASPPTENPLYERHQKIYPRQVSGRFATARISAAGTLLGIFYLLPWLSWNGQPAVLFDLPARRFHVFGITLWPQDFLFLAFFLMLAAYSLFFFTAIAGRLWCGYACPQSVWTESFLWIERLIEGNHAQQMKLDESPLDFRKFRLKFTKHALWIGFALYTGFSFVAYFSPARDLAARVLGLQLGGAETFWLLFYGFATYGNAGFLREQVCKYMCPYARFQSAMFDRDTLIVAYDEQRGEPRGARRSDEPPGVRGQGDCINCTLCVQVCPTGIDIRKGLQYECIGCSACIDVCNSVMDRMNTPRGLIRYTTQNAIEGGSVRVLRPRIIVYGLILLLLAGVFSWRLATRVPLALDVLHDRNQLYRETAGQIENVYLLKVMNKDALDHRYTLNAAGIDGLTVKLDQPEISVPAGTLLNLPVSLLADESALSQRSTGVRFELVTADAPTVRVTADARFLGPAP